MSQRRSALGLKPLAPSIQRPELSPAEIDHPTGQSAPLFNPRTHARWIRPRHDPCRLRRWRHSASSGINPSGSVKAEHGPGSDANAVLWNRAEHESTGGEAGTVDNDALARLTYPRKKSQIIFH